MGGPLGLGHVGEQLLEPGRAHHRAGQVVRAARLALLDHRHRDLAEALHEIGVVGQQLEQPVGTGQPGRSAADDDYADVDPFLLGIELALDELADRVDRRWELAGRYRPAAVRRSHAGDQPPRLALMASVSLGRILFKSPTIPRSENSKIGALASLLIATMFSEDCIPTLCWIAPEIPAARYSFGATVLPVCPICAAYGYQPASTTARVAATAEFPPNAAASSSASLKFSALPSPRPPATRMSAPSMSTSAPRCSPRWTISAWVDHGEYSMSTSTTSADPPSRETASNALIRPMMIPSSPL